MEVKDKKAVTARVEAKNEIRLDKAEEIIYNEHANKKNMKVIEKKRSFDVNYIETKEVKEENEMKEVWEAKKSLGRNTGRDKEINYEKIDETNTYETKVGESNFLKVEDLNGNHINIFTYSSCLEQYDDDISIQVGTLNNKSNYQIQNNQNHSKESSADFEYKTEKEASDDGVSQTTNNHLNNKLKERDNLEIMDNIEVDNFEY